MHLHVLGRVLVKEVLVPSLDTLGGANWQITMIPFASLVFDRPPDMFGGWGGVGWGGGWRDSVRGGGWPSPGWWEGAVGRGERGRPGWMSEGRQPGGD